MRIVLVALLALPALSLGMFGPLDNVPIDRLIANTEKEVKKRPKAAEPRYQLGRLFSMLFAKDAKTVYVYLGGNRQLSNDERIKQNPHYGFAPYEAIQLAREKAGKRLTPTQLQYLRRSLEEYRKATQLAPKDPLAKLGFAWMQEEAAPYASQVGKVAWIPSAKPTSLDFRKYAAKSYRELHLAEKQHDISQKMRLGLPNELPAREAAESLLRLFKMGVTAKPFEVEDLQKTIEAVAKIPRAITPIVFPVAQTSVASMFNPSARVNFDLAGDDAKRQWPWITANAAFLAWDPKGTGKIESGRQLFGTGTFWMMYRDGYEALSSLDDDRDGWLTGRELNGIVAWQDRNENAKSDRGEVVPLATMGIAAIRVRADGRTNGMLSASRGLRLADGGFLPTYDWAPTSHPSK